jgi:hypothetical protein
MARFWERACSDNDELELRFYLRVPSGKYRSFGKTKIPCWSCQNLPILFKTCCALDTNTSWIADIQSPWLKGICQMETSNLHVFVIFIESPSTKHYLNQAITFLLLRYCLGYGLEKACERSISCLSELSDIEIQAICPSADSFFGARKQGFSFMADSSLEMDDIGLEDTQQQSQLADCMITCDQSLEKLFKVPCRCLECTCRFWDSKNNERDHVIHRLQSTIADASTWYFSILTTPQQRLRSFLAFSIATEKLFSGCGRGRRPNNVARYY